MAALAGHREHAPPPSCPPWVEERLRTAISDLVYVRVEGAPPPAAECGEAGEAGALALTLTVVSPAFDGQKLLARHRLVNTALLPELTSGAVHSLPCLQTLTPTQWRARSTSDPLAWVHQKLRGAIPRIEHLEVHDLSDGHTAQGYADGSKRSLNPNGIELGITVVSPSFDGMRLLERQRLVGGALRAELSSGAVHSLPRLRTLTPKQWRARAVVAGARL